MVAFTSTRSFNPSITTSRDFILLEKLDSGGRSLGVRINGKGYDDPVTEFVKLGSLEKWRFINTTDDAHPMHLHLVQFRVLERQGFDPAAMSKGALRLVGTPRPSAANEAGWKDTAVVNPRDVLTILVRFEGYTGRYVFHCHVLEHEDNDMMRPYEVVSAPEWTGDPRSPVRILTAPYSWDCTDHSPTRPVSREPAGWVGSPTVRC